MWDFFSNVLEHAGIVALIYVLTMIGGGFVVRALWTRVREAENEKTEAVATVEARVEKVRADEGAKRAGMREATEREKVELERRLRSEHAEQIEKINAQLLEVVAQRRAEAERYAKRIDELQEKRVIEAGAVVERVVRHVESTKQGLERLANTLDVMIEMIKR